MFVTVIALVIIPRYEHRGATDANRANAVTFASLIAHWNPDNADITIMDPLDWDRKGNYGKLLDAVREASKGNDVRVYRVPKDGTRVEYWLVSRAEDRIVGVKAMAVES